MGPIGDRRSRRRYWNSLRTASRAPMSRSLVPRPSSKEPKTGWRRGRRARHRAGKPRAPFSTSLPLPHLMTSNFGNDETLAVSAARNRARSSSGPFEPALRLGTVGCWRDGPFASERLRQRRPPPALRSVTIANRGRARVVNRLAHAWRPRQVPINGLRPERALHQRTQIDPGVDTDQRRPPPVLCCRQNRRLLRFRS
jgi:hypothetical protein